MKYFVTLPSGQERVVDIVEAPEGGTTVSVDGTPIETAFLSPPGADSNTLKIGHRTIELWLEGAPPNLGVVADGQRFFATVESERMRIKARSKGADAGGDSIVKSPMPGRVVRVSVKEGDEVSAGDSVVVVEAMKMENELTATRAGKVLKVHVAAGTAVESGAKLIEIG